MPLGYKMEDSEVMKLLSSPCRAAIHDCAAHSVQSPWQCQLPANVARPLPPWGRCSSGESRPAHPIPQTAAGQHPEALRT